MSHCWGDPALQHEIQVWAADPSNLLPLKKWPKTFQQAVYIARSLGIPYLWVDTACIYQNDEEDFAIEAAKMAKYYVGATLVIAAVHAKDSREGLFATRNPLHVRPCPIRFNNYNEMKFFVSLSPPEDFTQPAETKPLHNRAWVLQEIMLSRRTVNFCQDQMRWSCILKKASENHPEGMTIDSIHWQFQQQSFLKAFLHHPPLALQSEDIELRLWREKLLPAYQTYQPIYPGNPLDTEEYRRNPAYRMWYDCVQNFTNMDITFHRDALPGMSGFAQLMHRAIGAGDTYVAGIWERDLVRGLLWVIYLVPKARCPAEFVAPSWSWASRIGDRIGYFFDETIMCDPHWEVTPNMRSLLVALRPHSLRVETKLKFADAPYGEVTAGALRCSARLLRGGKIGSQLAKNSIYQRAHPAYHRGLGDRRKDDKIANWRFTIPAPWAKNMVNPPQKDADELKIALQKHSAVTSEYGKPRGLDEHLYALYCARRRNASEDSVETANTDLGSNGRPSSTDTSNSGSLSSLEKLSGSRQSPPPTLHQLPAPLSANTTEELHGEIALDSYHAGHLLLPYHYKVAEREIFVLLLWPFKFARDRCIGLGLVPTGNGEREYKRVGRVELAVQHSRLWDWTEECREFEEVVIV